MRGRLRLGKRAGRVTVGGMSRSAIYPGSFDPVTLGHLDVIRRASLLFDEVIVAVAYNGQKVPLFNVEERVALIKTALAGIGLEKVKVTCFDGLLVDFARQEGSSVIIRGLRAISDFEYEFQMALVNRKLLPSIETVFLTPKEDLMYLSSRIVKEVARLGGHLNQFVTPNVEEALRRQFSSP